MATPSDVGAQTQGDLVTDEPQEPVLKKKNIRRFSDWDHPSQLQAFLAWLPQELHDAPGVDWSSCPPLVMGYCIRGIQITPDTPVLAAALASALGGMETFTLRKMMRDLNRLFSVLRVDCQMKCLSDLDHESIWHKFLAKTNRTSSMRDSLKYYVTLTRKYFPGYLQRLQPAERVRMSIYFPPVLPLDFLNKHFPASLFRKEQQERRKAQSDVVVPLYPILRQLIRFRKQAAERMIQAIREAQMRVEAGEAELPLSFQHTDSIPEINTDARSVAEVRIVGREVTLHFLLWDKRSWTLAHKDRFASSAVLWEAENQKGAYAPGSNSYFVQYTGAHASDLLWFGDLVEHRVFQEFRADYQVDESYEKRFQFARTMGFCNGCGIHRPGMLSTGNRWFSEQHLQDGDMVFDAEALYRGIVFGSALAMIALSNGSRMSELLQVSWNKERRITRTETIPILSPDGLPPYGADGKPLMRQVKIHLQHLLPKGAKSEEERQLFPLSKEAVRLLGEVKQILQETHGEIPLVHPSRSSCKYDHLKPERYLFQWAATPDGKHGILDMNDVQILIRFMFHGLEIYTTSGKPIRISTHLLRHVMATHARQYRHVPPEVVAHFFLHHRLQRLPGYTSSEVSDYYFQMTEEQRFAIIRADLDEQEELDHALMQVAPSPRDLEQKNMDLQAVYDVWQTLHPTALGNCGCPGLCHRGQDRALCIGCSYLVEDPERIGAALAWRASYAKHADLLEAQGNVIDARQVRLKVHKLDDHINVMRLQLQAEKDGRYIPLSKVLPSSTFQDRGEYEEEI